MCKVICLDFWNTTYSNNNHAERYRYITSYIAENFNVSQQLIQQLLQQFDSINRNKQISIIDRLNYIENILQIKLTIECKKDIEKNVSAAVLKFPPQIFSGLPEFLSKNSVQNKIFIVSNTNYSYGIDLRKLLQKDGLMHYFNDCFFSDELKMRKTNGLLFQHIIKKYNLQGEKLYFIGDSETHDILPALEYNFYCIKKCTAENFDAETSAHYKFLEYKELICFFENGDE